MAVALRLAAIVVSYGCISASQAVEWPPPVWTPSVALGVGVADFSMDDGTALDALKLLDNECGLVFGFAALDSAEQALPRLSLRVKDKTVRDILQQLQQSAPPELVFAEARGVPTVVYRPRTGEGPAFLDLPAPAFDPGDVDIPLVKRSLADTLRAVPGIPRLYSHLSGPTGAKPFRRVSFDGGSVMELLGEVAACLGESWIIGGSVTSGTAYLQFGQAWGLSRDLLGAASRSPEAPREPLPDRPPSRDAVEERVSAALVRGRIAIHETDAAIADIIGLMDDPWASKNVGGLTDSIEVLGAARALEAVPVLVRHISLSVYQLPGFQLFWETEQEGFAYVKDPRQRADGIYRFWLGMFPAVEALTGIGLPSVGPAMAALAEIDGAISPNGPKPEGARDEPETRIILLCETLSRILGREVAISRLREAAAEQEDPAKAGRLSEAADRIDRGLVPEP